MQTLLFKYFLLLSFILPFFNEPSVRSDQEHYNKNNDNYLLLVKNANKWGNLTAQGEYDNVIANARSFFTPWLTDAYTPSVAYAGLYLAQAHLFKGKFDSTNVYLETIGQYVSSMEKDITWQLIYYNLRALYSVKAQLDYPEAIKYFNQALRLVRARHDPINETILLCNMVNLYIIREDTTGFTYAREAYKSGSETNNMYAKCFAAIHMARMYLLKANAAGSLEYIKTAEEIAIRNNMNYLKSQIYLLYAEYNVLVNADNAEAYYLKSTEYTQAASPEITISLYCSYGNFLVGKKRFREAETKLKEALTLSETYRDKEQLHTLLFNLGNLYKETGQKDSTIKYYSLFHDAIGNSVLSAHNERRITIIEQDFKKEEYLKSQKDNKKKIIIYSFLIGTALFFSLLSSKIYKQKKLAKRNEISRENERRKERQLLDRLSELIEKEKIYRHHDISLDKLANILETNRSYISKVINSHMGMNFHSYINMLRINEAVSILSDPNNDIPVKALAGHLGYNSLPVFYVAFSKKTGTTPSKYQAKCRK